MCDAANRRVRENSYSAVLPTCSAQASACRSSGCGETPARRKQYETVRQAAVAAAAKKRGCLVRLLLVDADELVDLIIGTVTGSQ